MSDASGVLSLHKTFLKKDNHINDYEFDEIAAMLDADEEPEARAAVEVGIVVQINSVLTRRGIPLWVPAAGRHKALPLHGQNFPGHLYVLYRQESPGSGL